MPEGDSVHRVAARLQALVGERVEAESPHPRGLATGVARAVNGRRLERVEAVGKNLLLHFDGGVAVRSHLRMSGRWRIDRNAGAPHGAPWLVLRTARWTATQWNGPVLTLDVRTVRTLGPDVLADEVTVEDLVAAVRRADPGTQLGELLLDQRVVAGIGTVWLSETLWRARLSPRLPVGSVADERLLEALAWCRESMRAAVTSHRAARSVYRRTGRPCRRCGDAVAAGRIGDANRAVYWCPRCQKVGFARREP